MSPLARVGTVAVVALSLLILLLPLLPLQLWPFAVSASALALLPALLAGLLALGAALLPDRPAVAGGSRSSGWSGRERAAWLCLAGGLLLRACGEGGQLMRTLSPPGAGTLAGVLPISAQQLLLQICLLAFPLLLLLSLPLWPAAAAGQERLLLALDTLLALLAVVGLAWNLGVFVDLSWPPAFDLLLWQTLIRPLADLFLIAAAVLLLLRLTVATNLAYRQPPLRLSLLCLAAGLSLYALADLLLLRAPLWSWSWLGPVAWRDQELEAAMAAALLLCGLAAYLRRALQPCRKGEAAAGQLSREEVPLLRLGSGPLAPTTQLRPLPPLLALPTLLLIACCAVLAWNSWQSGQQQLFSGLLILGLAIVVACLRLLLTVREHRRLGNLLLGCYQPEMHHLETQLYSASRRGNLLEAQLARLAEVLGRLAAGDLAARLEPGEEELKPLAASLNQLADREMRLELWNQHNQLLRTALEDLCAALERCPAGEPLVIPASCEGIPQIERLLAVTGLRQFAEEPRRSPESVSSQAALPPLFPPGGAAEQSSASLGPPWMV